MEYVYTALLLNSAGKKVTEESVKKVMTAAGAKPDASRVKALIAALEGIDIKEAVEKAVPAATPAATPAPAGKKEEEKEEKDEKEEVSEEQAAAGLGALFG